MSFIRSPGLQAALALAYPAGCGGDVPKCHCISIAAAARLGVGKSPIGEMGCEEAKGCIESVGWVRGLIDRVIRRLFARA